MIERTAEMRIGRRTARFGVPPSGGRRGLLPAKAGTPNRAGASHDPNLNPMNRNDQLMKTRVALPQTLLLALSMFTLPTTEVSRAAGTEPSHPATDLDQLKTFGTAGKAVYPFTEGSKTEATLFEHEGKGCLTHMWFGGNWPDWERQRIRVYVDGEAKASIDLPQEIGLPSRVPPSHKFERILSQACL